MWHVCILGASKYNYEQYHLCVRLNITLFLPSGNGRVYLEPSFIS